MVDEHPRAQPSSEAPTEAAGWQTPAFAVIPLDCEITAYAPDGDDPLF